MCLDCLLFFSFVEDGGEFRLAPALFLPVLIIVYAQMRQNQSISGRSDWFISANDGFNLYLGQSRREAVMGVDFESQLFHVFYNDNSVTPYLFHPPIALPVLSYGSRTFCF